LLPGVPIADVSTITREADLVFIAVPDRELASVVEDLAASGALRAGQFVVHPAGRYGLDVLEPAAVAGAVPLAIHPALPLTGTTMDLDRLTGAAFGVTAPEGMRSIAEALVVELGGEPVWVPEQARAAYHAALALAANYSMTLVNEAVAILQDTGAESPQRILGPLVRASIETALERGDRAQTGPISRADASTVAEHVRVLRENSPLAAQAYRALGRLTVDRLLEVGVLDTDGASSVLRELEETP
jgi:predicted short-subunit dehydrogenase-like oxidoreductase (DUF2520 family)